MCKRYISLFILICVLSSDTSFIFPVESNGSTMPWEKTKSFCKIGVAASGVIVGGLLGSYYIAKHRNPQTQPTVDNLIHDGNEKGASVIFAHGMSGDGDYVLNYMESHERNHRGLFTKNQHYITSFDFPDSTDRRSVKRIKNDQCAIGQKNDIDRLASISEKTLEGRNNAIGFGVSRGAATWVNYMGTKKNKQVKALVLEASFAHVDNVAANVASHFNILGKFSPFIWFAKKLVQAIYPQYRQNGVQPINVIENIDKEVPIILIHSKQDAVIPINESRKLYLKRKQQGYNNVYLVELEYGHHASALWGEDGKMFQSAVHAFYKKHGFSYDEKLAQNVNLESCQPSVEEVEERIKNK